MVDKKRIAKKLKKGAVGTGLALGLTVSSLFGSPAEITDPAADLNPPPVVMTIDASQADGNADISTDSSDSAVEEKGWKRIVSIVKKWLLSLPPAVRSLVVVPLWYLGYFVSGLFGALGSMIGALPVSVLQWLALTAFMILAIIVGLKSAFPNLPIKELLTKANFKWLVVGMLVLGAVTIGLPYVADGKFAKYEPLIRLAGSLILVAVPCIAVTVKHKTEGERA